MIDEGSKQSIFGAIRALFMVAGAWLAGHKYIDEGAADQIIGALMILLPAAYGMWLDKQSEAKTKAREHNAVNVGIAIADATVGPTAAIAADKVPAVIAAIPPSVVVAPVTSADTVATVAAITGNPASPPVNEGK